jgi:hypothetical protein
VEPINNQLIESQTFSSLVTGTAGNQARNEQEIVKLLDKFPYAQILHTLHARCFTPGTAEFDRQLAKAALYSPDRSVLYRAINDPFFFQPAAEPQPPVGDLTETNEAVSAAEEILEEVAAIDVTVDEPLTVEAIQPAEEDPELTANETLTTAGAIDIAEEAFPDLEETGPGNQELDEQPETDTAGQLKRDETDNLILSNIAATDFFRFGQKLDISNNPPAAVELSESEEDEPGEVMAEEGTSTTDVSKYDDENLPYTFLWWLSKTRKEHADTYQPFKLDTTQEIKTGSGQELNQQIIENIFHLQSPLEHMQQPARSVQFQLKRKEEEIIERFIKEEPQIRPPRPEKLDTENKARRSSEDSQDVVSETLAQIYIEQMLFDKAIDTYRKLSLKFPEKSTYFAHQIRKLENR